MITQDCLYGEHTHVSGPNLVFFGEGWWGARHGYSITWLLRLRYGQHNVCGIVCIGSRYQLVRWYSPLKFVVSFAKCRGFYINYLFANGAFLFPRKRPVFHYNQGRYYPVSEVILSDKITLNILNLSSNLFFIWLEMKAALPNCKFSTQQSTILSYNHGSQFVIKYDGLAEYCFIKVF